MGHQDRRTAATSTLVETLIRKALRGIVVDRFIASCTERGLSLVAPQEFRNWLLAEGVSLGFMPIQDQLSWWRYLIWGLLPIFLAATSLIIGSRPHPDRSLHPARFPIRSRGIFFPSMCI